MTQAQQVPKSSRSPSLAERVLICIPPGELGRVWPMAKNHLDRACVRTPKSEIEQVFQSIANEECQLWMLWDTKHRSSTGAIVTEILSYPTGYRAVRIVLGGGVMDGWPEQIATIEAFARDEGCHGVEIVGRRGWARVMAEQGYEETERVIAKRLN